MDTRVLLDPDAPIRPGETRPDRRARQRRLSLSSCLASASQLWVYVPLLAIVLAVFVTLLARRS